MFERILVPLDGSTLSESSLGAAAALATSFNASVSLLHLIEQDAPAEVHHERHLTTSKEAQAYLKQVAARAFPASVRVETHVHTAPVSDVALGIVQHATEEDQADLIVTCTHGRGGVRDLLYGSIAQRVVAQGQLPLLLIKPERPSFDVRKILLPLDPDSNHDESLVPAAELTGSFKAHLELISVIPTVGSLTGEEAATSSLMPMTSHALLQLREDEAAEHLRQHVQTLTAQDLDVSAVVARGDPVSQIVQAAQARDADLIVLSTHRKTGLEAFWSKSVAPRVAQTTKIPLLLLPLA